ncbi:MAG: hypothetical protein U5L98_12865 [Halomonas sp.]|uniref:hypothetical protein n=1 Tax=Halomonas sp. TaxID=1486246 RepID=UPI002ACD68D8|nr:hypothetical protein [Halomonas sp.]MDZ7853498.1 hypothetical protein [Halomonas sp.]
MDKLKGGTPQTKLWHLYKTVCGRSLPIHLVEYDLLITPAVLDELMRWDALTFDQWKDAPARRAMLKLRQSWQDGPCRSSVGDSFRQETEALEKAIKLFFLLVWEKAVDTRDPKFLDGGNLPKCPELSFGFA